jgi:hypothetical protein
MFLIDNILVSEDILETEFSCDLAECKGACCTFPGEYGAPLLKEEVAEIEQCLSAAYKYLPETAKEIIKRNGFTDDEHGELAVRCIDKKDCVFVFYEGDIAKCALEKAYFEEGTSFRKPISCHLFPVRVSHFGGDSLFYAEIPECKPALKYGKQKNEYIYENVKEALIRAYGQRWYKLLEDFVKSKKNDI